MDPNELLAKWTRRNDSMPRAHRGFAYAVMDAIAAGQAPTVDGAAARCGMGPAEARNAADALVEAGLMTVDGDRITGALGLSAVQTPHRLTLNGRPLHAWCAIDAVGIPAALRA
ncbi:MAG: organomercurial lyase, partial [Methanobacteriota archaeon]